MGTIAGEPPARYPFSCPNYGSPCRRKGKKKTSADYTPDKRDISPSNHGKLSVADEVALTMGIPEMLVQMAQSFQLLEHGTDFKKAQDLYTFAEDLLNNPKKQCYVAKKLAEAKERAVEDEARKKEKEKEKEKKEKGKVKMSAGMMVKQAEMPAAKENAVRDHAAISRPVETQGEAVPKEAEVDTAEQLKEKVQKLARDNHRLRQRKTCRQCKEVELAISGVTFLPCGHFITCEACSELCVDCPSCGKAIMGTVRTYLS